MRPRSIKSSWTFCKSHGDFGVGLLQIYLLLTPPLLRPCTSSACVKNGSMLLNREAMLVGHVLVGRSLGREILFERNVRNTEMEFFRRRAASTGMMGRAGMTKIAENKRGSTGLAFHQPQLANFRRLALASITTQTQRRSLLHFDGCIARFVKMCLLTTWQTRQFCDEMRNEASGLAFDQAGRGGNRSSSDPP